MVAGSVAGDGDLSVGLGEAAGLAHRGPGGGTRTGRAVVERRAPCSGVEMREKGGRRAQWLARARHGVEVLLHRPRGG
jgi:hypothetical protein